MAIFSCKQEKKRGYPVLGSGGVFNEGDSLTSLRVVMRVRDQCDQVPGIFKIADEDLIGSWEGSLEWNYRKGCWHAVEHIDRKRFCEFYSSGKYVWNVKFTETSWDGTRQGEFWMYNKNDSNFIVLAFNSKGDTFFPHGDTMWAHTFLVYMLNDSVLKMRGQAKEGYEKEMIEMRRYNKSK